MLVENHKGQITRQPCHKCGAVRQQDYLHLEEVAPHDIQFVCDTCPTVTFDTDEGKVTHVIEDGIIDAAVKFAGVVGLLMFGAFWALCFLLK